MITSLTSSCTSSLLSPCQLHWLLCYFFSALIIRPPQKVIPLGLPLSTLGYFPQGPSTHAHPTFPSSLHHITSCQDFLDNPFQNCKLPTLLQNSLLFTFFHSTLSSSVLYNLLICGVQNLYPVFFHWNVCSMKVRTFFVVIWFLKLTIFHISISAHT